ncbi:MAG: DNA-binding response regulator [Ignavibacteriales bacterium CG18_big_fil_WC_8_21_14_2_50_31_20]|nr:MAG: DNA-binding response regulator [Ignavibacteriales bacterium CG18_big_fil_WC_8_21_14_2_50_31_20]
MIRVLLADDHSLFRDGLKALLDNESTIKIIGEAEDGRGLVKKYFDLCPDIVISDISMPNKTGTEAAKAILNKDKNAKIIFLSQHTEDNYIYEVLKCGAFGLVGKNIVKNELIIAIESVYKGKHYFIGRTEQELKAILSRFNDIVEKNGDFILDSLTERENEVLIAIGNGFDRDKLARTLKISVRTLDTHRFRIMSKIGVKKQPELIKFAMDLKLKKERELEKIKPFNEN